MTFNELAQVCQGLISGAAHTLIVDTTARHDVTFTALGEQIPIAWAARDLPRFTPASAALLQMEIQTSTSESGPTLTSTPSSASPSGLSADTKVGMGVGIACGVLLLVATLVCLFHKRTRKARGIAQPSQAMSELQGHGVERRLELGSESQIREIGNMKELAEADHTHVRYEVEGIWHGHEAHGPRSAL
jgi:C4-dicarboxylate-specific signal transduction histidine kinase